MVRDSSLGDVSCRAQRLRAELSRSAGWDLLNVLFPKCPAVACHLRHRAHRRADDGEPLLRSHARLARRCRRPSARVTLCDDAGVLHRTTRSPLTFRVVVIPIPISPFARREHVASRVQPPSPFDHLRHGRVIERLR